MKIDLEKAIASHVCQWSKPHGDIQLAPAVGKRAARTFGGVGCFASCHMILAALTHGLDVSDVGALVDRIRAGGGFVGASLNSPQAWEALGGARPLRRVAYDRAVLQAHCDNGGAAIVGIDYKEGRSSGFSDADHFLVVCAFEPIVTVELAPRGPVSDDDVDGNLPNVNPKEATGAFVVLDPASARPKGRLPRLLEMEKAFVPYKGEHRSHFCEMLLPSL